MAYKLPNKAIAVIALVTLSTGLIHGSLDGRWGSQRDVRKVGAELANLPNSFGPWVMTSDRNLDASSQRILNCHGSLVREYWNSQNGQRVNIALLFGPRGPIAVHTPEICYTSIGTEQVAHRKRETINTSDGENHLWNVQFRNQGEQKTSLDTWYAWSDGGPWLASQYPRLWLTKSLYKLQVASDTTLNEGEFPCRDFLTHFLPVARKLIK